MGSSSTTRTRKPAGKLSILSEEYPISSMISGRSLNSFRDRQEDVADSKSSSITGTSNFSKTKRNNWFQLSQNMTINKNTITPTAITTNIKTISSKIWEKKKMKEKENRGERERSEEEIRNRRVSSRK